MTSTLRSRPLASTLARSAQSLPSGAGTQFGVRRVLAAVLVTGVAATGLLVTVPTSALADGPTAISAPSPLLSAVASPAAGDVHGGGPSNGAVQTTARCSSTPFRSDPNHKIWFRVPAIVKTTSGTLLAFAEKRERELGDMGDFDVAYTRSTDGGCSWAKYRVIGNDGRNRVSNPVPVVDQTTGTILLFSVIAQYRGTATQGLYLQTSTDDGKTFSALLPGKIRPAGHYKGGLTGPGHAIQLSVTHSGRIIVPIGYKTPGGLYGAYGIYSDDHGATWQTGFDQQDSSGKYDLMEGTIAELDSGKLFISFRLKHDLAKAGTARQYAISSDGGESLDGSFRALPLKIVSVQGSALGLKGSHHSQLLFSAPSDQTRNLRRDMSIFVSYTGGRSWSKGYHVELESKPASYSDLVQLSDNSVGVIYETGKKKWKERIAFEAATIPALTRPTLAPARIAYHATSSVSSSARAHVRVKVTVKGITHAPGRITLRYAGSGRSGAVSARFTYSTKGARTLSLPKLKKGTYRLKLVYSGTNRIKNASTPAGILRVR